MSAPTGWQVARALHADAVESFARATERIPTQLWATPLGPDRWTPAQVVVHLTLAYDALLLELGGGPPMKMRTAAWQRFLLRFTVRRRLLAGSYFPGGVRAPREVRPADTPVEQAGGVSRFREQAATFASALERASASGRPVRLTHPYLGSMDAVESMRFCAAHIRHHLAQLPTTDG